jgi:hypothetical protein
MFTVFEESTSLFVYKKERNKKKSIYFKKKIPTKTKNNNLLPLDDEKHLK